MTCTRAYVSLTVYFQLHIELHLNTAGMNPYAGENVSETVVANLQVWILHRYVIFGWVFKNAIETHKYVRDLCT
jgi:hypothetical protein